MSHVDEGTLHAYLDSELPSAERATLERHLETCATCRGLLAEERALLERASALLGSARPVERPAPPFEKVRRMPKRSPWYVRTSVAWAASLALALGLGYVIRGSNSSVEPSTADAPHQEAEEDKAREPASVALAPQASPRQEAAGRRTNPPPPPTRDRAPEDANVAKLGLEDTTVSGVIALQPRMQLRGAAPAAGAERQRVADSLAPLRDSTRLQEAVVVVDGAALPSAAASAGRMYYRSTRNLGSTTWPLISRGAAASLLGDRPVGVPGLATRRIRRSPGPDSTVVVEQALDSTTLIQVFQRRANSTYGHDSLAAERSDRILARYVGRLRVEISGPISTDSLNKLLEQVEPIP
jgi:hypothetical protein